MNATAEKDVETFESYMNLCATDGVVGVLQNLHDVILCAAETDENRKVTAAAKELCAKLKECFELAGTIDANMGKGDEPACFDKKAKVRITSVDMNGFLGRDFHPAPKDVGRVGTVVAHELVSDGDDSEAYYVHTVVFPDGDVLELIGHEIEPNTLFDLHEGA